MAGIALLGSRLDVALGILAGTRLIRERALWRQGREALA